MADKKENLIEEEVKETKKATRKKNKIQSYLSQM